MAIAALDAAVKAAEQAQFERDCAAICVACNDGSSTNPNLAEPLAREAIYREGKWVHLASDGRRSGTCRATDIRAARARQLSGERNA